MWNRKTEKNPIKSIRLKEKVDGEKQRNKDRNNEGKERERVNQMKIDGDNKEERKRKEFKVKEINRMKGSWNLYVQKLRKKENDDIRNQEKLCVAFFK